MRRLISLSVSEIISFFVLHEFFVWDFVKGQIRKKNLTKKVLEVFREWRIENRNLRFLISKVSSTKEKDIC